MTSKTSTTSERDTLAELLNMTEFTSETQCEETSVATVITLDKAGSRFAEQTITAKTNVGLMVFRAAKIRCESDESGKTTMPELKLATVGKLGKILGLTDTPGKGERGCSERFGYRLGTLGACVDLARGVIGDVDVVARDAVADSGESLNERTLRTAILAKLNPEAIRNRQTGARNMAAAKLAAASGKAAGAIVKVDGKAVKVDAEMLVKVKNTTSASVLTPAQLAAASDDQLAATLKAIQLVIAAREAGTVKAPAKPTVKASKASKAA